MSSTDLFARVTHQIVKAIEAGTESYQMPWHEWCQCNALPANAISRRSYRGINTIILWAAAEANGFRSENWATYRQWSLLGGQVRRRERATTIVFWKGQSTNDNEELGEHKRPGVIAKTYCVFNAEQVDGVKCTDPRSNYSNNVRLADIDNFLKSIDAKIHHGGDMAYYSPSLDRIYIPYLSQFRDSQSYYSVLSHECVHWSGAGHRLNRNLTGRFGSEAYAVEELIAELGSAFIAGYFGVAVEPRADHAAYIASWLKVLNNDTRAILTASAKAQEAVDYLTDFCPGQSRNGAAAHEVVDALGLEPRTR